MTEEAINYTMNIDAIDGGYQAILDTIFCSILIFDKHERLIHCNKAAVSLFREFGVDAAAAVYTGFDVFASLLKEKVDLVNGMGRYIVKYDDRLLICNVHPWLVNNLRRGTIVILHESTHPNCVIQELDVTTSLLQEINIFVESSHDGFMVTDSQGVVIRVNSAFEKAFSVQRKNVIGRKVTDLIADGLYSESAALKVLETHDTATVVLNKNEKKIIATATPAFDSCGGFSSVVVNIRDITELNDLESSLVHQRMVAEGYIRELAFMRSQQDSEADFVVHSKEMKHILDTIKTVSQVDSTILISGESGVGKEMVLNQIYKYSSRKDKPIVKINCAAIPSSLFESELFGYEEGAFTGARRKGKAGFFELANEGTLFLDEVGELDMDLQAKLLRVIQDGEVTRIGGTKTVHADVRIVAATNRDLQQMVADREFRSDLYYRLNVFPIRIPPLRERPEDIPLLVKAFTFKIAHRLGRNIDSIPAETLRTLSNQPWPGNVRELENVVERAVLLTRGNVLQLSMAEMSVPQSPDAPVETPQEGEDEYQLIVRILRETNGVVAGPKGAAQRLGLKRTTLLSRMKRLGIDKDRLH